MKNNILILCFLVFGFFQASSQVGPKIGISTGWGFFQSKFIGTKIHLDQKNSVGLYLGDKLYYREIAYSAITLDHCYHFGKLSSKAQKPNWYIKNGLILGRSKINMSNYKANIKYGFYNLTLGREFYLNKKLSIGTDLGFVVPIVESKKVSYDYRNQGRLLYRESTDFFAIPSFAIQLNYSI